MAALDQPLSDKVAPTATTPKMDSGQPGHTERLESNPRKLASLGSARAIRHAVTQPISRAEPSSHVDNDGPLGGSKPDDRSVNMRPNSGARPCTIDMTTKSQTRTTASADTKRAPDFMVSPPRRPVAVSY